MKRMLASVLGIVTCAALLAGCPPPAVPFNASGVYTGVWTGTENGAPVQCALSLVLTHDPSLPFPRNVRVSGTATLDFLCTALATQLQDTGNPTSVDVEVTGVIGADGRIVLADGGCPPGFCVVLAFNGPGEDNNSDGNMDFYSGDWNFTVFPPGIQPATFAGGFTVAPAP